MITFLVCIAVLIAGYLLYGRYIDKLFGPDDRPTPAVVIADGVDYVAMPAWKTYLIQFLNIAGLGPIYGAVAGAMYGPVVFLWITLGTVFGGAVHDYFCGMLSMRYNGSNLPEILGHFLGRFFRIFSRFLIVVALFLVGTVFVKGPASILSGMTVSAGIAFLNYHRWAILIFLYFMVACVFPIDKIIGRIYPFFGFALIFMAVSLMVGLAVHHADMPELTAATFRGLHPNPTFHAFPMMFISVACGAISGFHATQSPLMARCIRSEKEGRKVFYGAMVTEGIVALIWAAASMTFFGSLANFQDKMLSAGNDAGVIVSAIANGWLGKFGAVLALLGVVAAPITSADTALRSCRLIIADGLGLDQKNIYYRIVLVLPLFVVSTYLLTLNFDVIWRYFAFTNQLLATLTLWATSIYLYRRCRQNDPGRPKHWLRRLLLYRFYMVTLWPAAFMTVVCTTYILYAPEGFRLPYTTSLIAGISTGVMLLIFFYTIRGNKEVPLR